MATRRTKKQTKNQETPSNKLVGVQTLIETNSVFPNGWNPNEMTQPMYESLKHGLKNDGWISSQALLVWGKDDAGQERNVIIDGEHRWRAAMELHFAQVPAVVVDGLSEREAKALTIKMNSKRGEFDSLALLDLLTELAPGVEQEAVSLEYGLFDVTVLDALLREEPTTTIPTHSKIDTSVKSTSKHVLKRVVLFFNDADHERFDASIKLLSVTYKTDNVSETVLASLTMAIANASR
jgi:hypothetical protein